MLAADVEAGTAVGCTAVVAVGAAVCDGKMVAGAEDGELGVLVAALQADRITVTASINMLSVVRTQPKGRMARRYGEALIDGDVVFTVV